MTVTALYSRFKADESAQSITGSYRLLNLEDNLERQPIHEHVNRYPAAAAAGNADSRAARAARGTAPVAQQAAGAAAHAGGGGQ